MVYYIVGCFKEESTEDDVLSVIQTKVLKDGNRSLGDLFSLRDGVSGE
jgi:hypothetical protein